MPTSEATTRIIRKTSGRHKPLRQQDLVRGMIVERDGHRLAMPDIGLQHTYPSLQQAQHGFARLLVCLRNGWSASAGFRHVVTGA